MSKTVFSVLNHIYETSEDAEFACREYAERHIDDYLDDIFPLVNLGFGNFLASEILKELDPVAYACSIDDYEYELIDEIEEIEIDEEDE